jgi:hypothetical protein
VKKHRFAIFSEDNMEIFGQGTDPAIPARSPPQRRVTPMCYSTRIQN